MRPYDEAPFSPRPKSVRLPVLRIALDTDQRHDLSQVEGAAAQLVLLHLRNVIDPDGYHVETDPAGVRRELPHGTSHVQPRPLCPG